jgi:D-tyrosyl-tRNA(Tyr) deacylase
MRIVIQRVNDAKVEVNGKVVGKIGKGLLILVGIGKGDSEKDFEYISNKIVNLRIFEDENSHFNKSLRDVNGEVLIVSQFTLYGDCRKGRRPSFDNAENVDKSREIYENFVKYFKDKFPDIKVEQGVFQEFMQVHLINNGPVTFILDSKKTF